MSWAGRNRAWNKAKRNLQVMGVSTTTTDGEPIRTYTGIFVIPAEKIEVRGFDEDFFSQEVNVSLVDFKVDFRDEFRSQAKNYAALRIMEVIGTPVMTANIGLFGNYLYDLASDHNMYDILDLEELGVRDSLLIHCRLWK